MPGKVKVNGAWKDVPEVYTKVNGAWKTVAEAYTKVNGTWQQWFELGGAMELISSTTLTGSAATVTLSSNGAWSDYKHLYLMAFITTTASQQDTLTLKPNNSGSFDFATMTGREGTGGIQQQRVTGASEIDLDEATNNNATHLEVWMPYLNDDQFKSFIIENSGIFQSGFDGFGGITFGSALRQSTDVITSLVLNLQSSSFAVNSTFKLYGYKG